MNSYRDENNHHGANAGEADGDHRPDADLFNCSRKVLQAVTTGMLKSQEIRSKTVTLTGKWSTVHSFLYLLFSG